MKEAIGNRLDRVSRESNEALRAAAVLGKTFTFEELMAITGDRQEESTLDALDEAAGAQLITAEGGDSFTFTHDKIREVLYEELNPVRRRRLHRLAAESFERRRSVGGALQYPAEKLSYHYIQAGDYEHGLVYARQAAAEAERVFAFDEAIAAYGRARDCAEALGLIDEQLSQEKAIGRTYVLHGEMIAAGEHFERALGLAQDPQMRAHLHSLAAASLVTTGDQRGLYHLREALAALDPKINPLGTANAISIEGRFHHLAGRHTKAIDLLERAAGLVAPIAEQDSVTQFAASIIPRIYGYLSGAYQHYGRFLDADRWAQRAVDFGVTHSVLFAQALGLEYLGENALHSGDFIAGIEYAEREREIAATLHSRERRGWTHYIAAQCAFYSGDPGRAEREFVEGITLAESIGELRLASLLKGSFAVLRADQASEYRARGVSDRYGATAPTGSGIGRVEGQRSLDDAWQNALDNFQAGETSDLLYSRFEGRRCLAAVRFRRGEFDEAERLCAAASELVSGTESRLSRLWLGPLFIEALIAVGLRAEAEGKVDEAAAKRSLAAEHLATYRELVADCQSPHFTREATQLADLIALSFKAS